MYAPAPDIAAFPWKSKDRRIKKEKSIHKKIRVDSRPPVLSLPKDSRANNLEFILEVKSKIMKKKIPVSFLVFTLSLIFLAGCASSTQKGIASWYGEGYHGKPTANGEIYDMYSMTAAHKTLAFGTIVEVRDLDSGKEVVVRINNRGPFIKGRIIDLSYSAAKELGILDKGITPCEVTILKKP